MLFTAGRIRDGGRAGDVASVLIGLAVHGLVVERHAADQKGLCDLNYVGPERRTVPCLGGDAVGIA